MLLVQLAQLLLVNDFQGYQELGTLLSCKVNMAELASANWFADFEIIDLPFLRVEHSRAG